MLAVERVRINQQGIGNKHFKMYQFKEALKDPMTWAFAFYALVADIPNGGISNFFSQLVYLSPPLCFPCTILTWVRSRHLATQRSKVYYTAPPAAQSKSSP